MTILTNNRMMSSLILFLVLCEQIAWADEPKAAVICNSSDKDSRKVELQRAELPSTDKGFRSLFNGKDLSGWEGELSLWKVVDNKIVGDSAGIAHNQFLCSKDEFSDFELKLEFRLKDGIGNTGVQFRTKRVPNSTEVSGYQADIGENYWGCLYDESRRNKILVKAPVDFEQSIKKDDWNAYSIIAKGDHIVLKMNDVTTVDYIEPDPEIPRKGILALQVHSGGPLKIEFRNIQVKSLAE